MVDHQEHTLDFVLVHATKKIRPKFERKRTGPLISIPTDSGMRHDQMFTMTPFTPSQTPRNQHEGPEETLNFGADISTLIMLIEEGKL